MSPDHFYPSTRSLLSLSSPSGYPLGSSSTPPTPYTSIAPLKFVLPARPSSRDEAHPSTTILNRYSLPILNPTSPRKGARLYLSNLPWLSPDRDETYEEELQILLNPYVNREQIFDFGTSSIGTRIAFTDVAEDEVTDILRFVHGALWEGRRIRIELAHDQRKVDPVYDHCIRFPDPPTSYTQRSTSKDRPSELTNFPPPNIFAAAMSNARPLAHSHPSNTSRKELGDSSIKYRDGKGTRDILAKFPELNSPVIGPESHILASSPPESPISPPLRCRSVPRESPTSPDLFTTLTQPILEPPTPVFSRTIQVPVPFHHLTPTEAYEALSTVSPFTKGDRSQILYEEYLRAQIGESREIYLGPFEAMSSFSKRNEEFARIAAAGESSL